MHTFYKFCFIVIFCSPILSALPTDQKQAEKEVAEVQQSASPWKIKWSYYNVAAVTTAIIVVGAGIAGLTALFFPIFVYKICYALGGCQNTLDSYVDKLVGVEGTTRKINKRSVDYLTPALSLLYSAYEKYYDSTEENETHSVSKRSADYMEPIFEILSEALEEYANAGSKKNLEKKTPYRRLPH